MTTEKSMGGDRRNERDKGESRESREGKNTIDHVCVTTA